MDECSLQGKQGGRLLVQLSIMAENPTRLPSWVTRVQFSLIHWTETFAKRSLLLKYLFLSFHNPCPNKSRQAASWHLHSSFPMWPNQNNLKGCIFLHWPLGGPREPVAASSSQCPTLPLEEQAVVLNPRCPTSNNSYCILLPLFRFSCPQSIRGVLESCQPSAW